MENRVEMRVLKKLQVLTSLKTSEEKLQWKEEDRALLERIVQATLITICMLGNGFIGPSQVQQGPSPCLDVVFWRALCCKVEFHSEESFVTQTSC